MSHFFVNDSGANRPSTHSQCVDHVNVNGLWERVSNAAEENSHSAEVALSIGWRIVSSQMTYDVPY